MNKQDVLSRLEAERAALNGLIEPLTPEQFLAAGQGGYCVKDILAVLAVRVSRVVTLLFSAERGRQPPELHAILGESGNTGAQESAELDTLSDALKNRPLHLVLSDHHGAHRQLLRRLAGWSEVDLIDRRKYRWARGHSIADLVLSQVAEQDAACRAIIAAMLQKP